jgi:endonuclease V-like protein UPF0215 family
MRYLKRQSRVMGIDDGPYVRGSPRTPIVMTIWRLNGYIEGFLVAMVTTDGEDSAEVISRILVESRFHEQVRCIISDGACLAGFNALDLDLLHRKTSIPVITSSDETPKTSSIIKALEVAGLSSGRRLEIITEHEPFEYRSPDGPIFLRTCGMTREEAIKTIEKTVIHGRVPEPVRISHMIAKAMYPVGII